MAKSTILIAASNSTAADKARADSVCDNTADQTEINTAITTLQAAGGGAVLLCPGTYTLSATIAITGAGDVDVEQDIALLGSGPSNTIIDATPLTNSAGITITGSAKVHIHNLRVNVDGGTHGIASAGTLNATAGYRSFWQSSFKNLSVVGDFSAHTGYAYHFGSPFRSVFENLEAVGVGNGMRMYSEDNNFNPGDCTIQRCFMDIVGNSHFAYKIESTVTDGNMNQMEFIMCEGIASGTGCTGVWLGGTGPVTHTKWHGINLEQFDTHVNFSNGQGNVVDGNYWELRGTTGLNGLVFGTGSADNEVSRVGFWYVATASNMISKAGGTAGQPNIIKQVALFCDGAALALGYTVGAGVDSATPGTGSLLRKQISNGGGTSAGTNVVVAPGATNF